MKQIEIKKLKDIAKILTGVSISSVNRLPIGNWGFIRGRNIVESSVTSSDIYVSDNLASKYSRSIVVPGDILLSVQFEQYKVGIVPRGFPLAIADRSVVIIRPNKTSKEYLLQYLISKTGRKELIKQLSNKVRGNVIKFVTAKDVADMDVPILPLNLLASDQAKSKTLTELHTLRAKFERDVVNNLVRLLISSKGWNEDDVVAEYPVSSSLRADLVLKKNGKPIALIEIKKDQREYKSALNQIQMMGKILGIKTGYFISGDGIVECNFNTLESKQINDIPSKQEIEL